jgi:hypothetical protein
MEYGEAELPLEKFPMVSNLLSNVLLRFQDQKAQTFARPNSEHAS